MGTVPACHAVSCGSGIGPLVLKDERWAALEPLLGACRPRGKTPPRDLRRTVGAIVRRRRNGATWRAVPAGLGPWWRAARLLIRRAELGAWRRLLEAARARGVELGTVFVDGSSIGAHRGAAGVPEEGGPVRNATGGRRSAGRAAASARRRASPPTGGAARSPS